MSRLPKPGSDDGQWGDILNNFLKQTLSDTGTLKDGIVTTDNLADGSVSTTKLTDNAITTAKLAPGSVTAASLAPNAVATSTIQDNAVSGTKLTDNTVTSSKLADTAVTTAKLVDKAVTATKLSPLTDPTADQILSYNGTNLAWIDKPTTTVPVIPDHSLTALKLNTPTTPTPVNGDVLVLDSSAPGGFKWQAVSSGSSAPSGPAGGDLSGTYPNPTVPGLSTKADVSSVYTKTQVDSTFIPVSQKGANSGVATLDSTGKVPSSQLPSGTAQVQSDWNETSSTSAGFIQNKPSLSTVATSGSYADLTNKPTIPSAQVNSDWNATSGVAQIVNKPSLSSVATSGSYDDLTNKPTIPTVTGTNTGDQTLTLMGSSLSISGTSGNSVTLPAGSDDIKNQTASAQAASYWIDGSARVEDRTVLGGGSTDQVPVVVRGNVNQSATNPLIQFQDNTTGEVARLQAGYGENIFLGNHTGSGNTGSYNTAMGSHALEVNTGSNNTAFGENALRSNTSGQNNVAVGGGALYNATTAQGITAIGRNSLLTLTTGDWNTAVGLEALFSTTTGYGNVGVGTGALQDNTEGNGNVAVGNHALWKNTTASSTTAVGTNALENNTTGGYNTAHGAQALRANTTGSGNTAVGESALALNTIGNYSTAVGASALSAATTTATNNTAVGAGALRLTTTGAFNTALGAGALIINTTGSQNTASGISALASNTTGSDNVAIGYDSLYSNNAGSGNVAIGDNALFLNTTGNNNVAVGYNAGNQDQGGAFKTPANIGASTAIGHHAQVQDSNCLVLGSVDVDTRVGIGTTIPRNTFSVSPVIHDDGTAAVTTAGAVVTGTNTNWPTWLAGYHFIFANGQSAMIASVQSATQLTLATSLPVISAQAYRIHTAGFNVTSTGRVGIRTANPTYDFQVQGTMYSDRIHGGYIVQQGRYTSGTDTTYNGQWTRIMSTSITAQYQDVRTIAMLTSVGESGFMDRVMIDIKVKQQSALGSPPNVSVLLSNVIAINPADVSAVITENSTTRSTVELWLRVQREYQMFNISQVMNTYGNAEWQYDQPFQATLPTGTAVGSMYAADTAEWSSTVPASITSTGIKGQKAYDANYLYICVADNTWRRTALSTW